MNASEEYLQCTEYAGATDEDLEWFEKFSFWIEGVFQLGIGKFSIYFFIDCIVIYIRITNFAVKMDKMKNIQNFMLNHVLYYHFPKQTC